MYPHATKTSSEGIQSGAAQGTYNVTAQNNVFAGVESGVRAGGGGNYTLTNNIFVNNTDDINTTVGTFTLNSNATDQGAGEGTNGVNISAVKNTLFTDIANFNFHRETTETYLTGHGQNLSGTFTTDIDGDLFPESGAWPIGIDSDVVTGDNSGIDADLQPISAELTNDVIGTTSFEPQLQPAIAFITNIDQAIVSYVVNNVDGGYITGETTQVLAIGGTGTQVIANANSGYEFLGWSLEYPTMDYGHPTYHTPTNIPESITITAHFGNINRMTSGTRTFGIGGDYIDYNHAVRQLVVQIQ
jgi:hypothetical protein